MTPESNVRSVRKTAAIAAVGLLTLTTNTVRAADAAVDVSKLPPASKQKAAYAKDIKPLFDSTCTKCHGAEKQKGGLRLDSLEAALKGGENGKVIQPGNSEKSVLIHQVARLKADEGMPPEGKGDPLTKEQVALLRGWIDQGAK